MSKKTKPKGHWEVKENCKEVALKYKSRNDFKKGEMGAYYSCWKNGWLDEVCSHMEQIIKPKGHWEVKENCKEVALKYKSRIDFQKGEGGAYTSCRKNGWLDEVCSHMNTKKTKPKGHWKVKDKCKEVALKYKRRSDFKKGDEGAYMSCWKNGWLDEVCSHMESYCDDTKKSIYALEFPNKIAYIGLSNNPHRRFKQHIKTSSGKYVRKYIDKHNEIPTLKILREGLSSVNAGENENHYMEIYKQNGFTLLNVAPAGSLGNQGLIWTKDKCKEVALKYKRRSDFKKGEGGAHESCRKNGWLDEVCSHMKGCRKTLTF